MKSRADAVVERGSALIVALFAAVVLSGLGLGLLMLSSTEGTIAANYRGSNETLYAADAAVARVLADVIATPNWTDILRGAVRSGFIDRTLTPTLPTNQAINLVSLTAEVQGASDAVLAFGSNNPKWMLFAYGRLSDLAPAGVINSHEYIVVWVSDDAGDGDADPSTDSNGLVTILAQSMGQRGSNRALEVTVARTETESVGSQTPPAAPEPPDSTNGGTPVRTRILSWREVR